MPTATIPEMVLPSSVSSRVTASATGLARQILSASEETTSDLTALRTAHKLSRNGGGAGGGSEERRPKALSIRQRHGNLGTPTPRKPHGFCPEEDLEEEFSGFLLGEGSASNSRSASPLKAIRDGEGRIALERNDSMDPEGFRAAWKSPSHAVTDESFHPSGDIEADQAWTPRQDGELDAYFQPWDHRRLSQNEHDQSWTFRSPTPLLQEPAQASQEARVGAGSVQKHQALERLRLLYSHLPVLRAVEKAAAAATPRNLETSNLSASRAAQKAAATTSTRQDAESTFSQFCHGEDTQAWHEASMSIGRTGQRHDWLRSLETAEAARMEQENAILQQTMTEMPQTTRQHFMQRPSQPQPQQPQRREQGNDPEEMPDFHCPYVECHRRLRACVDHVRDTRDVDGLPCVHVGCEDRFEDEATWRQHVLVAHHGLLPLRRAGVDGGEADMEGAWAGARVQ